MNPNVEHQKVLTRKTISAKAEVADVRLQMFARVLSEAVGFGIRARHNSDRRFESPQNL